MKDLLKKFRENKKGFTLAELLVVVAIVAILVAISVPIFTTQLGKARRATNQANMRAAKVAAISQYLTDGHDGEKTYVYSIEAGTVTVATDSFKKDDYKIKTIDEAATDKVYDSIAVAVEVKAASSTSKDGDATVVKILVK